MNHRFLQLHLLTAYGPANLNRDDLGQPKSATVGTVPRLRISSQCLKRTWRNSDLFQQALDGHLGTRTKHIGPMAEKEMLKNGLDAKLAFEWSKLIAQAFGKLKGAESNEIETLVFMSNEEQQAVLKLARTLAERKSAPTEAELKLLRKDNATADLALFGRMLTADKSRRTETSDRPGYNVDAAAQVAHAFTVHRAVPEDDYFSAVDDLSSAEETGSGHLGELGFGAGVFYLYACVDRQLLLDNLGGDRELADRTLRAFSECMASVAPTGKQNAFASRARASFGLAELGNDAPRQLSAAFLRPVSDSNDSDVLSASVKRLVDLVEKFDLVYGHEGQRMHFNCSSANADRLDTGVTVDRSKPVLQQWTAFAASGLQE
jgi:CRISPR system Cascade subunit CasC